ncbi:MAG: TetR/AcrR family transcriptional regulator [Sphingobium sp.]
MSLVNKIANNTVAAPNDGRRPAGLGRKGAQTRQRFMDAGRELLQTNSAVTLTATAVAKAAGMSPASFYVYFGDVADLVFALAADANDDLDEVFAVLDRWSAGELDAVAGATAFYTAYRAHWDQHRVVLNIRDMEANCGNTRFIYMRRDAGRLLIDRLARLVDQAHEGTSDFLHEEALARATVVFAAVERLSAAATLYPDKAIEGRDAMPDALRSAQIAILAELTTPVRPG